MTAIRLTLGELVLLGGLLLSAGGMIYQLRAQQQAIEALTQQVASQERLLRDIEITLRVKGVIQ